MGINNTIEEVPSKYEENFIFKLDKRLDITHELIAKFKRIEDDLGGDSSLSYLQQSLIQRYLFLEYWLQETEKKLIKGKEVDIGKWVQSINSAQGVIAKLGLEKKPKDIFADYEFLNPPK
jgi:hypothetical protein